MRNHSLTYACYYLGTSTVEIEESYYINIKKKCQNLKSGSGF